MEKEFGKVRPGQEESHAMMLMPSESHALKVHRELQAYYAEPVICLLRIKESIDTWIKRNGSDGYFDFIEQTSCTRKLTASS